MISEVALTGSSTWILLACAIVTALYRYGTRTYNFFASQGIPGPKPFPWIGNAWKAWNTDMQKADLALTKKYGKTFGYFLGPIPVLFTTDPVLIQQIFVKNFDHFSDKRQETSGLKAKYFRRFVGFIPGGPMWKDVRSSISLAFTSSKISQMSNMIYTCLDKLNERLENIAGSTGKIDNPKMIFGSFMKDVIANCVYGTDAMESDEYTKKAFSVTHIPFLSTPLVAINFMFPRLRDWFPAKIREGRIANSNLYIFMNEMTRQVRKRWETGSDAGIGDFIDVASKSLLSASKEVGDKGEHKQLWTKEQAEEVLVAHGGGFMVAGFETAYAILFATMYELAKHPEVQEKLFNELQEKLELHGSFSADLIKDVTYADCVIKEVLRLHLPVKRMIRQCTKDITIGDIHFKKGMMVFVPLHALHRSEDNFEQPDKFIPERWLSGKTEKNHQCSFLPFGVGPRVCIGQRFAMHELRLAISSTVLNFRFSTLPETPDEFLYDTTANIVGSAQDLAIAVESRKKIRNF